MEIKSFVNYITAYNYIVASLKSRKKTRGNLDIRHIVVTPDRYTLSLEKNIMKDLGENGSFDVSVMTFDRLLNNEGVFIKYLSRYGGAMLIRRIIDESSSSQGQDNFLCFNRIMLKGSFPAEMYDTLMQLKSCQISPEMEVNTENSHLNNKLSDIKYIYKKYEEFLNENKMADSGSKLDILQQQAHSSEYIKNAYFYFYGFDSLTPQGYSLIKTLDKCSKGAFLAAVSDANEVYPKLNVTKSPDISLISDFHKFIYQHLNNRDNVQFSHPVPIRIYRANTRPAMLTEVCRLITEHIRKGGKFSDIALVGNISEKDLAILNEADISYNYDHKISLSIHPIVRFLKDCIDAVRTHYNSGTAHIAKNFFSGVEYYKACIFENYCLKYNISHNIFSPFTLGKEEQDFETAEKVRIHLARLLKTLEQNLTKCVTVEDYITSLKTFFQDNNLEKRFEEYNQNYATSDFLPYARQCLDKLYAVMNEAHILYGYRINIQDFRSMLFSGIDAVELSAIPAINDGVNVTDIEGLRCEQYKHIIYLDCVDGMFPVIDKDLGMLSDGDLDYLNKLNIKIEPKIRQVNKRRKFNLIQSLYLGQNLHFLYCKNDNGEDRIEANILHNIKVLFPFHIETDEDSDNMLLSLHEKTSKDDILRYFYNLVSSKRFIITQYKKAIAERQEVLGTPISSAACALNIDFSPKQKSTFDYTFNKDVFFATQLENYFKCPYIYLSQHILKLKKRPEGNINAIDVGNILHSIMEKFVGYNPKDFDECDKIITDITFQIISENEKLKSNQHFSNMLLNEAINTGRAVFDQNQNSDFEVIFTEKKFGSGENLPALEIPTVNGIINIAGKIDRIDAFEDYVRIIDYKSGKIKTSMSEIIQDIYSGKNLQLMLYMKAVQNALNKKPFASLYFPINNDFAIEKKPRYEMQGLISDDINAILAADKRLSIDNPKSDVLPVNLKVNEQGIEVKNGTSVLSEHEFESTLNYSKILTKNAIEEISSGYFEPSPSAGACNWCEYKGVCCRPYENEREFQNMDIKKNTIAKLGNKQE